LPTDSCDATLESIGGSLRASRLCLTLTAAAPFATLSSSLAS